MIFAVFNPSPLTVCINCIFYIYNCCFITSFEVLSRLLIMSISYYICSIFQDGGRRHLGFSKFPVIVVVIVISVKGFPYALPSVGPGADSGMYWQSAPQMTLIRLSHPSGGRLLLLSAMLAVTFPVAEHHRPLADTHFTVPRRVEG